MLQQQQTTRSPVPLRASDPARQAVLTKPPQSAKKQRDAEDTITGRPMPQSVMRHRPLQPPKIFEIPMQDGTVWRVTERQLQDLPAEWHTFARPIPNAPGAAPAQLPYSAIDDPVTEDQGEVPKRSGRRRGIGLFRWLRGRTGHPVLYLGIGMLGMLILWTVLAYLVGWVGTTLDDLHYGRPRTFQIDAVVGHNDSASSPSHFIAINLNGKIEIIEMPGGDASHARIYIGPQLYGANADLVPVTLSFVDVKGNSKPNMLIHFQGTEVVFINDAGGYRVATQQERDQVNQFLAAHPH